MNLEILSQSAQTTIVLHSKEYLYEYTIFGREYLD